MRSGGGELAELPGQARTVAAHIPTGLAQAVVPASMPIFDNKYKRLCHLLCVIIDRRMGIVPFPSRLGTVQKFPAGVGTSS